MSIVAVGRSSVRRPWRAIAAWLGFVVVAISLGVLSGTKTLDNGAVGESARGYGIMDRQELWPAAREVAYIHDPSGDQGSLLRAARVDAERRFSALGLSADSVSSADRRSVAVTGSLRRPVALAKIEAAVASLASSYPTLTVEQTGDISNDQARNKVVDQDLRRAELLSIPVTMIVLLLVFGSLTAALVPLVLALTAVAATLGLLGPLSQITPVQDSAKTVVLLVGMAVGVDYALFYVSRCRAERGCGAEESEALDLAIRTSGRTVAISGGTVAIALAGLYLVGVPTLSGIATATIAVVLCAVLGSLTVLPATLALLGPRIDSGRIPFLARRHRGDEAGRWSAVVERVSRRPLLAAVGATALLVGLALPALSLHTSKPSDLALTAKDVSALKALADIRRAFPGAGEPAVVAVEGPASAQIEVARALAKLRDLAGKRGISSQLTQIGNAPDRTGAALFLPLSGDGANARSRHAVEALRASLVPATLGRIPGIETAVTGQTAEGMDFTRRIDHALPFVFAFVLTLAFCLLLVAFRSLIVPLKATLLNLLSVGAAYGVLALVFEHRFAEPLLDFHSNGTIVSWLPLFLFVILFGLSMDYHVFILSRVREAVERGQPTDQAVSQAISGTARVVTAAAFVMVCVFALFGTLSSLDLKQAGVGLAAAVSIDATVIRAILLPASMKLLGERNWYLPHWLNWLPEFNYEPSERPPLGPAVDQLT